MIAKTKIKLKDPEYQYIEEAGDEGMFFLSTDKGGLRYQYSCREELRDGWYNENYLGFAYNNLNIKGLNEILEYAEKRLKLPKNQRSLIYLTNYKNIIIIKISSFWAESIFRKDVLSLLVRCGAVYNTKGIKNALNTYTLTKQCLPALGLFLNGYTQLNFSMSPLVREYCYEDVEEQFYEGFEGFVDFTKRMGFKNLKDNYLIKG